MRSIQHLLIIIIASLSAGCANKVEVVRQSPPSIPVESQANVRHGEAIKAYPINRYVDPANPNIMHERHVVYRVEQNNRWRTQANANQQILVGNTLTRSAMNTRDTAARSDAASTSTAKRQLERQAGEIERTMQGIARQLAALQEQQTGSTNEAARSDTEEMNALKTQLTELRALLTDTRKELDDIRTQLASRDARSATAPSNRSGLAPASQTPVQMLDDTITEEERQLSEQMIP